MPLNSDKILIIHNDVESDNSRWSQSHSGVLDQVRAVADTLAQGACRILPVRSLGHLAGLLPDCGEKIVFNLIEEFPCWPLDACYVPAVCAALGKSCTGNDTPALLLALNKFHAKAVLTAAGLPCPAGVVINPGSAVPDDALPSGLYIVKPALCDASEGILEDCVAEYPGRQISVLVERIHRQFNQPAILEQFIPAGELNISLLEEGGKTKVLPIAEIDFSAFPEDKFRIVDYSAKWLPGSFAYNNTPRRIPAQLPDNTAGAVRSLARRAWDILGCRDYARVDLRLGRQNRPFIIEVNPNPDITPDAGFGAALAAAEISYEYFVSTVLENARMRLESISNNS